MTELEIAIEILTNLKTERVSCTSRSAGSIDYSKPTPSTDKFMLMIDDSEIDMSMVKDRLHDMEIERNYYRDLVLNQ